MMTLAYYVRKSGLILGLLFLWVPVVLLALEVCAAADTWWIETHNEFILAAKGQQPRPSSGPPAPLEGVEEVCQVCRTQPGWDSPTETYSLPAWAEPRALESKEGAEHRRGEFPQLEDRERQLYALLNNEWVLVLDGDAGVKHVYGNWLFRSPIEAGIRTLELREFKKSLMGSGVFPLAESKAYLKLALGSVPGIENEKEVLLLKGNMEEPLYAFIPNDFLTVRFSDLPRDSPWDGIPFFRYKKDLRNTYSGLGLLFDTNNFGFRDHDVAIPKPSNVLRLVCIGGSTTEEGPSNDTTYPKRLERMLNGCLTGERRIEVLNCGVSGMTTSALVARLADYLALQPDMLIVYEGVNDIHRDLVEYWRTVDSALSRRVMRHSRFARWGFNRDLYPDDATLRKGIQGLCIENLRAIGYVARSHHIRLGLCAIASPDPERLSEREQQFFDYCARAAGLDPCLNLESYRHILGLFNQEVHALCEREGYLYLPVGDDYTGGYDCFTDLYHMTDSGIERKAELLFACLKDYLRPAVLYNRGG